MIITAIINLFNNKLCQIKFFKVTFESVNVAQLFWRLL